VAAAFMAGYMCKAAGEYTPPQLYEALAASETGGEKNPFIRTKVRPAAGSTAYGPVQITGPTAADFTNRLKGSLSPDVLRYAQQMSNQSKLFLQHGNNKSKPGYDSTYDYGGTGHLGQTPTQQALYRKFAEAMIQRMYQNSGGDIGKFIQRWRGEADPKYTQAVRAYLGAVK